jgi:hypothetical protein
MIDKDYNQTSTTGAAQGFGTAEGGSASTQDTSGNLVGGLRERAQGAWDATRDRAGTVYHSGEEVFRNNPVPSLLGALAVGFLFGFLFGSREEETWQERYVEKPLERSQGALLGAALGLAALFRRCLNTTADAAHDAAKGARSYSKPLGKVARRAGRKLHLV